MRPMKTACALGISALLIGLFASTSSAQGRAPYIRIVSENGPGVASNYVMPAIDLSEDAYVFAVAMDLDGQISVLHPDFPGISVRLTQHQQYRLPNFFAGFSQSGGGVIAPERYVTYSGYDGGFDTRGTVIALASRAPFNLERIEIDGDWDITAIRRLIQNVSPFAAEQALASYLGAKGEPIGRDFMRFASLQQQFYSSNALYNCDFFNGGYSTSLAFSRLAILDGVRRFQRSGGSARIIGYDYCGIPIVAYGPSHRSRNVEPPRTGREPRDTVKTKRFGREIPRHAPTGAEGSRAALGYFPITRHAEPPQIGDVTITAPDQRRRDPREVLIDMRNPGGGGALPERSGVPIGRASAPSHASGGAATGTETIQEYTRPAPRESPPPPRTQPTQSPPPRVEPPRSPPPSSSPPPRVQSPPSKSADSPPPRR
ncbi:MAG: hypothetical protein ACREMS_05430 [Gemmatimonadaceae bacterium]